MNFIKNRAKKNNVFIENDPCFKIIALGGDAKSKIQEALEKIKKKKYVVIN